MKKPRPPRGFCTPFHLFPSSTIAKPERGILRRLPCPSVFLPHFLPLIVVPFLAGCNELGYYSQAVRGHLALINGCWLLVEVVADPATPPALRERLTLVASLRDFASHETRSPRQRCLSWLHRP